MMVRNLTDETEMDAEDQECIRYGELSIDDEKHVVYDRQNHRAWVQSTRAVPLDELR